MRVWDERAWDKGQGGSIVLFFLFTFAVAIPICLALVRLIYVTFGH